MDILKLFNKNSCAIDGKDSKQWTWQEYYEKRKELEQNGTQVVLVDMIDQPVEGSTPISNELFKDTHTEGTYFVLYCHSGGTSGSMQKKLTSLFPQYTFINMTGGIGAYHPPQE